MKVGQNNTQPTLSWKSKCASVSRPIELSIEEEMQGVRATHDAEVPPFISIVRHPVCPVMSGMDITWRTYPCGFLFVSSGWELHLWTYRSTRNDNTISLDNTIRTFWFLLSWCFPRKTVFLDDLSLYPNALPLKNFIFMFILSSRHLLT